MDVVGELDIPRAILADLKPEPRRSASMGQALGFLGVSGLGFKGLGFRVRVSRASGFMADVPGFFQC